VTVFPPTVPPALAPPPVIGHRGAAAYAPENTREGFAAAKALGCAWVEFDVALTRDGHPVLMHDETLARTAGAPGLLAETTLADLRRLDAGAWFGPRFQGCGVPTLADAVAALDDLGLGANVEIKPTAGTDAETARAAAGVIVDRWPDSLPPPLISSFSATALAAAFAAAPMLERAFLVDDPRTRGPGPSWERVCADLGCTGLHVNQSRITPHLIERAERRGLAVRAFTVNAPSRAARLFGWGVAGVFSDRPDRLLPVAPITGS
jgi:glycerophosphoryl diester phosphodiesterase